MIRRTAWPGAAEPLHSTRIPRGGGSRKHGKKSTVDLSGAERVAWEPAHLMLLVEHGVVADRDRPVREVVATLSAGFHARSGDSNIVGRLRPTENR